LDVNVVVGASSSAVAQAGGKKRKAAGPRKPPVPRTMSTRKNPLLIASLREMGINASSHVENPRHISSDAGTDQQMVAGSPLRDSLTSVGHPVPQLSTTSELSNPSGNAEPGPQMVARSRSRNSLTFVGQPEHQPSLLRLPETRISDIVPGPQMVAESRSRDPLTSVGQSRPRSALFRRGTNCSPVAGVTLARETLLLLTHRARAR
jgi:hypothetical protein